MYPVELAIYDLSRGMARLFSAQLLGVDDPSLDCIPHTALLVYGKEYFFGGGIQIVSSIPQFRATMGMHPMQVLDMGSTSLTCEQFEVWLDGQHVNWHPASYDLFHRNCNHFSHTVAVEGLRLSNGGIPDWILQVPTKVLATPLGQQLQPFLQQMQIPGVPGSGAGTTAGSAPGATCKNSTTSHINSISETTTTMAASFSSSTSSSYNPWGVTGMTTTSTTSTASTTSSSTSITTSTQLRAAEIAMTAANAPPKTPVLDTYRQPLLSNNIQAVSLCMGKLEKVVPHEDEQSIECLKQLEQCISQHFAGRRDSIRICKSMAEIFLSICTTLANESKKELTFGLMILRLLVLMTDEDDDDNDWNNVMIFDWIRKHSNILLSSSSQSTVQAMVYCIWSNMISSWKGQEQHRATTIEWMLEYVLPDHSEVTPKAIQVQLAALCVLYNLAWWKSGNCGSDSNDPVAEDDDIDEITVTLLCASVQGLIDQLQYDPRRIACYDNSHWLLLTRQLALIGRLSIPLAESLQQQQSKALLHDLGLADVLEDWVKSQQTPMEAIDKQENERVECLALAEELIAILSC